MYCWDEWSSLKWVRLLKRNQKELLLSHRDCNCCLCVRKVKWVEFSVVVLFSFASMFMNIAFGLRELTEVRGEGEIWASVWIICSWFVICDCVRILANEGNEELKTFGICALCMFNASRKEHLLSVCIVTYFFNLN